MPLRCPDNVPLEPRPSLRGTMRMSVSERDARAIRRWAGIAARAFAAALCTGIALLFVPSVLP